MGVVYLGSGTGLDLVRFLYVYCVEVNLVG